MLVMGWDFTTVVLDGGIVLICLPKLPWMDESKQQPSKPPLQRDWGIFNNVLMLFSVSVCGIQPYL